MFIFALPLHRAATCLIKLRCQKVGIMDEKKEAIEEEFVRRRNAEIARQLRAMQTLNSAQKFAKLLTEVLSIRR